MSDKEKVFFANTDEEDFKFPPIESPSERFITTPAGLIGADAASWHARTGTDQGAWVLAAIATLTVFLWSINP